MLVRASQPAHTLIEPVVCVAWIVILTLFGVGSSHADRLSAEQSFRATRSPAALLEMARQYASYNQRTEAADYYRRFRDSADLENTDRAQFDEASQYLSNFSETVAELQVRGPADAFLYAGKRLIGVLPLPGSVYLTPGEYIFSLELSKSRYTTPAPLEFTGGRASVLELEPAENGKLIYFSKSDDRWLLLLPPGIDAQVAAIMHTSVSQYAAEERKILISAERAIAFAKSQIGLWRCIENKDCRQPFVSHSELQVAFLVSLVTEVDSRYMIELKILDVKTRSEVGPFHASSDRRELAKNTLRLIKLSLAAMQSRGIGQVAVSSEPVGAQIFQGARWISSTPSRMDLFVGSQQLRLVRSGYVPQTVDVEVERDREVAVQVTLQRAPWRTLGGRPLWRVALGGSLLASGLVLGAFGISGLYMHYVNGGCGALDSSSLACPGYQSGPLGAGLLAGGGILVGIGTTLVAWPPRRKEP